MESQLPVAVGQNALPGMQIAEILGVSKRAVHKRAKKEDWPLKQDCSPSGHTLYLYIIDGLPDPVRHKVKIWQADQVEHSQGQVMPTRKEAKIPDRNKKIGLAKYRLVHAFRDHMAGCPHGGKAKALQAFILAYNSGKLLPTVYEKIGDIKAGTLRGLEKKLKDGKDDYTVLCDGRGGWMKHGTTRWRRRKLSNQCQAAFLQCYLQPTRPSFAMALRAARLILDKAEMPETASDDTFRRWFQKDYAPYNGHVITMARDGMKVYIDKWARFSDRDASMLEVGDVVVADGKVLNFLILHPDTGRPVRMCLIVFQDWASRYPVGWQLMPTENTAAIQAAFFHACLTLGKIPRVAYADNGKAFKSKVFINSDPDLEELAGLYARIGTAFQAAKPYWGRSKIVERFNLTFQEQLECLLPSFCGDSIANKPAWMHRNEIFHKQWHEAKTNGWVPNIREAASIIEAYMQWHVRQPHEGIDGRRPIDVLRAGKGPGIDEDAFRLEFLWRFTTRPRRCRITRWGIDYAVDFLEGWSEDVLVMYDTANLECLYIYDLQKNYLGEARPVEALHPMAKLLGEQASVDRVKKEAQKLRRQIKQTKADLLAIGASAEDVEALNALPYNRKVPVVTNDTGRVIPVAQRPALPEPELDAEEKRRLELVLEKEKARAAAEAAAQQMALRPDIFMNDREHYDWAFRAVYQKGLAIPDDDRSWMAWFETTEVFREKYSQHYADLRQIYGAPAPKVAATA